MCEYLTATRRDRNESEGWKLSWKYFLMFLKDFGYFYWNLMILSTEWSLPCRLMRYFLWNIHFSEIKFSSNRHTRRWFSSRINEDHWDVPTSCVFRWEKDFLHIHQRSWIFIVVEISREKKDSGSRKTLKFPLTIRKWKIPEKLFNFIFCVIMKWETWKVHRNFKIYLEKQRKVIVEVWSEIRQRSTHLKS